MVPRRRSGSLHLTNFGGSERSLWGPSLRLESGHRAATTHRCLSSGSRGQTPALHSAQARAVSGPRSTLSRAGSELPSHP